MCGSSEAHVGLYNLDLTVGAYGGQLELSGGNEWFTYNSEGYCGNSNYPDDNTPHDYLKARASMEAALRGRFTREELVEIILQFVDNGREG